MSLLLEADAAAPVLARRALAKALADWGLPHLSDDAQQLAAELVNDAVARAVALASVPSPVIFTATAEQSLTIRVSDPDPAPPPFGQLKPEALDVHGRGLFIVAAFSDQWGWTPAPNGGKYVWAILRTRLVSNHSENLGSAAV